MFIQAFTKEGESVYLNTDNVVYSAACKSVTGDIYYQCYTKNNDVFSVFKNVFEEAITVYNMQQKYDDIDFKTIDEILNDIRGIKPEDYEYDSPVNAIYKIKDDIIIEIETKIEESKLKRAISSMV